jgi:glycine/D-amino acid oxidase-like deaminating enzyme
LLAGSTSENAGFAKRHGRRNQLDTANTARDFACNSQLAVVDTWAGLRPRPADGLPVLGACGEIDGLFYATGHYRNGILLAPLTAELITEVIVAGVTSPLLAPFSPDRFSSQPVLR